MHDYKYIFMDLDGTIADPFTGLTNAIIYSLKKFGIEVEDRNMLIPFIGPPLEGSYMGVFGMSFEEATRATNYYREYYDDIGIYENELYSRTRELLDAIEAAGKQAVMATSKRDYQAEKLMVHYGLDKKFAMIAGAAADGSRESKHLVIEHAIKTLGIMDRSEIVMVGDRRYDIEGAMLSGLDSIGVLYGYGTREELETAGADVIVESMEELAEELGLTL